MESKVPGIFIGITGKRSLSAGQQSAVKPVLEQAIRNIAAAEGRQLREITGISPLAEGADTLFAKTVLELGGSIKCYLPFEVEAYLEDFSTDELRKEFEGIYASLRPENKTETGSLAQDQRNDLYLRVGQRVVAGSDYLIAIWDELPANGKGGTAEVVKYATEQMGAGKRLKQVLVINPREIPARIKVSHGIDAATGMAVGELPEALRRAIRYHEGASRNNKNSYLETWRITFWLGLAAAVIFALKLAYEPCAYWKPVLSAAETVALVAAIFYWYKRRPAAAHAKHLFQRGVAERLRNIATYYEARLAPKARTNPIFKSVFDAEELKNDWNNNTAPFMKMASLAQMPDYERNKRKEAVLRLVQGQIRYHEKRLKTEQFREKHEHAESLGKFLIWSFFAVLIFHLLEDWLDVLPEGLASFFAWLQDECVSRHLLFLSLVIPAWLAKIEATKFFLEREKFEMQSRSMISYFREQEARLVAGEDPIGVLDQADQDMFNENMDWQMLMIGKGHWTPGP